MCHLVPLLVDCGVFQAVVSGQVDDRGARGDEFWRHREGRRVRDSEEGHVEVGKRALIMFGENEVARTRERGVHLGERAPASASEVIAHSSKLGCPSKRRVSSAPAKPAAPTIPALIFIMSIPYRIGSRACGYANNEPLAASDASCGDARDTHRAKRTDNSNERGVPVQRGREKVTEKKRAKRHGARLCRRAKDVVGT